MTEHRSEETGFEKLKVEMEFDKNGAVSNGLSASVRDEFADCFDITDDCDLLCLTRKEAIALRDWLTKVLS